MVHGGGTRSGGARRGSTSSCSHNNRGNIGISRGFGGHRHSHSHHHPPLGPSIGGFFTPMPTLPIRRNVTNNYYFTPPVSTALPTPPRGNFDSHVVSNGGDWSRNFHNNGDVTEIAGEGSNCCGCCGPQNSNNSANISSHLRRSIPGLLILWAIIFSVLVIISGQNEIWTLNAGESRQIKPALLTSNVNVETVWNAHQLGVDISVFAIQDRQCPPLTGPTVKASHHHDMSLGIGDYQYDYFFLNAGSTVHATFTQSQGSSQILLLRGKDALSKLQGGIDNDDDWEGLVQGALSSWYVHSGGGSTNRMDFPSDRSDVYTFVYDNASHSTGKMTVEYSMDLSTYNLQGYSPICNDVVNNSCAPIKTRNSGCIIVDTSPPSNTDTVVEVTVKITSSRRWLVILLLSVLPGSLIVAWEVHKAKKQQGWQLLGTDPESEESNPSNDVIQSETVRIPAPIPAPPINNTNNSSMPTPSAPLEEPSANPVITPVPAPSAPVAPNAPAFENQQETSIPMATAEVIVANQSSEDATGAPIVIEVPIDQIDPLPVSKTYYTAG